MADRTFPAPDGAGDFADIWSERRTYLVALAFRMLGNIQDAEDVVQEAFSRLLDQDLATIDDARGELDALVDLLDPDVGGEVDLGISGMEPSPLHGRAAVGPNLLKFFGPKAR